MRRRRGLVSSFLGALLALCAGVAIVLAAQAWYVRTQVIDNAAFTQRAVKVVAEPSVRSAVGTEITDAVAGRAGISAAEIRSTVDGALGSRSFDAALRAGASSLNAALFHNGSGGQSLSINLGGLAGLGVVPSSVLDATTVRLVSARDESVLRYTNDAANVLRIACIVLPALALVALVLALAMVNRPARAVSMAGLAAAVVGAVTLPVLAQLRDKTVGGAHFQGGLSHRLDVDVATAIWNGFCGPMHTIASVALVGGAVVAIVFFLLSLRRRRRDRSDLRDLDGGGDRYIRA